ncbi:MAG: hypothetical protein ABR564_06640 [Candidatus Dormibacteria bacterium]
MNDGTAGRAEAGEAAAEQAAGAELGAAEAAAAEARRRAETAPGDASVQAGLAVALSTAASLHTRRALRAVNTPGRTGPFEEHRDRALALRREAVAAWDAAVAVAPDDATVHIGRGRALAALGSLETGIGGDPGQGVADQRRAVEAFTESLRLSPGNAEVHTRRGALQSAIGLSQHRSGEQESALESYQGALKDFQAAQEAGAPGAANLNEGGWVLVRAASAEAALGRHGDALTSLEGAISLFAESRRLEPENSFGPLSQGQAYAALGDLQATSTAQGGLAHAAAEDTTALEIQRSAIHSRLQRAMASYSQAINCLDQALALDPSGGSVTNSVKAETLQCLAELQVAVTRPADALATYREVLALYDGPLSVNTSSFQYQVGRGRTLLRMGELCGHLEQPAEAAALFEAARTELSRDVAIDEPIRSERERLLARAGRALAALPSE